jgi:osmotically-inducible protein OsmY
LNQLQTSGAVATQTSIKDAVVQGIRSDPRIPHPEEIAVFLDENAVMLRGTVGTFGQRRAAVKAANGVQGVDRVFDELSVHLLDAAQRSDAELRGIALQPIAWISRLRWSRDPRTQSLTRDSRTSPI